MFTGSPFPEVEKDNFTTNEKAEQNETNTVENKRDPTNSKSDTTLVNIQLFLFCSFHKWDLWILNRIYITQFLWEIRYRSQREGNKKVIAKFWEKKDI